MVSTHLKHISQIGSFPQIGMKHKQTCLSCHHPENNGRFSLTQETHANPTSTIGKNGDNSPHRGDGAVEISFPMSGGAARGFTVTIPSMVAVQWTFTNYAWMVDFNGKNEGKYINMDCLGNMSASFFVAVFFCLVLWVAFFWSSKQIWGWTKWEF